MLSIESKIITSVNRLRHGAIVFASDYAHLGEAKSVNKAFERLLRSEKLIRLARGIYCKPKIDTEFGMGVIYPGIDDVAKAIAKRDKCRVAPTGDAALNKLGLSTQVPMNAVYLTDGTPRRLKIYNGRGILFKRVVPKRLEFKSELLMLISFALQALGQNNVTEEHIARIKQLLQGDQSGIPNEDMKVIPGWIRSIIMRCYE